VSVGIGGVIVGAVLVGVLAPFATLVAAARPGSADLWTHLIAYVLLPASVDTAVLLVGVAGVTVIIGAGLAWLVTAFDFPGRRLLDACLLLPLAVPTYIVAYAYLDVLHPVGPVQETLRWMLGYEGPRAFRLPDIRSMPGCIGVLGFVLYPYVYLPTRALFAMQSASLLETGRTLGLSHGQTFLRIALPLARPAIALGLSLALMETLNDIGASEFLGVRTLTVSIYATWVTRSDLAGAAQIALAMLAVVLGLVLLERWARRHQRYVNDAQHPRPIVRVRLPPARAAAAILVTSLPIVIGFIIPSVYLAHAAATRVQLSGVPSSIFIALRSTVLFAAGATFAASVTGLAVAYAVRGFRHRNATGVVTLASIGYATPGTVVAIALLPMITGLDRVIDGAAQTWAGRGTGLLLLSSGIGVLYAYLVRFLAIAVGGTESALAKLPRTLDDAAATLGAPPRERLWLIHLPLIHRAIAASAVLIFVDCMKELPATLLLRPLGVETLSTLLYGEAARGTYENGAIAALLIVGVGLLPVFLLSRLADHRRQNGGRGSRRRTEDERKCP
jgi:iron(III) transport system permease protein